MHLDEYKYQQIHDEKLAASICVSAVVQVTSFDPAKMTVNVQPLSKGLQNGNYESSPPILGIPVACTKSGGFLFRPWLKAGDTGVVVYLDRESDGSVMGGKETIPSSRRNHSSSDSIFVGAIVPGNFTVSGLPDESIVLATEDGGKYVAITKEKILIKGDVEVDGSVKVSSGIIG